jgi:hypothetical protein
VDPILDGPPGPRFKASKRLKIVSVILILSANFSEVYRNKLPAESGTMYDLDM